MNVCLARPLLIASFVTLPLLVRAGTAKVSWPSRQSEVLCGGQADGQDLDFDAVSDANLLRAETGDHRVIMYLDLRKAGRVRIVTAELMTDDDFDARKAIFARLEEKDAKFLQRLSANRFTEMYVGLADGLLDSRTSMGDKSLKFSCQEIPADRP